MQTETDHANAPMSAQAQEHARLEASGEGWALSGSLTVRSLHMVLRQLDGLTGSPVHLDVSGLGKMDTAGAYALTRLDARLQGQGGSLHLDGLNGDHHALLERVAQAVPAVDAPKRRAFNLIDWLDALGRKVAGAGVFLAELHSMLGLFLARLFYLIRHPSEFRMTALVHHCDQVGWKAVPIVALMGFLIGVVLAFQGSVQLR